MTAAPPSRSSRSFPSARRLALLLIPLAVGAGVGAYLDWMWWHPTSGILVTIMAGGLLVLSVLAWSSRWQPIRPVVLWVAAFAIGMLLGQNVGPSRPPISLVSGSLAVELTEPADAQPASGSADCQLTPDGLNFQVSGDPNIRIEIGDQPREEQDNLQVSIARGDMWQYGEPRSDGWSLIVAVSDTGPFTDDEAPPIWFMETAPSSELTGDGTQTAGSVSFDGLVLNASQSQGVDEPMELSGTIAWSCDGPPLGPER
ncbi:MAG TPA: hypothetical protein VFP30_07890 [Candidatus Limnocylindria bacterium]|nr:hypothetical protein [Candidatus Limnocylindria bacterium]